VRAQNEDTSIH